MAYPHLCSQNALLLRALSVIHAHNSGILFQKYRRKFYWWKLVYFFTRILSSAVIAIPIEGLGLGQHRNGVAAAVSIVYVLYAASVLVVRPYIRFAFTVIDVIINLLLAAVAGLSIVNTRAAPSAAPTTGGGGGGGGGRLLLRAPRHRKIVERIPEDARHAADQQLGGA